jgi:immune inhibitor A
MSEPSKRRRARAAVAALGSAGLLLSGLVTATQASAAPPSRPRAEKVAKGTGDNRLAPWAKQQQKMRTLALQQKLNGVASAQGKVAKLGKGKYVKLANEGSDRIFVVLAEFGDTRHEDFPDSVEGEPASDALKFDGPLHNQIPKPDRSVDNSTLWQPDYNEAHYKDLYFNRMARYYESQSSGRYTVNGDVTEWVKVPFNEARYGRDYCGEITCNNTWFLIRDALAYWTDQQLAAGRSMAEISAYLATFDKQDRYDIDGDGVFAEPDGFIDHFQIVHAGGDQAADDPTYGSDAIWSHRWYAAVSEGGPGGLPGVNIGEGGSSSGVEIPNHPTGTWVGDYTIQPENGGLGVFAHEFGHDLGLPDLYDTSGNTGGAENSTAFWTLMSSGANIGDGSQDGIGDAPTDLGAWEKLQLGWLGCDDCPGGSFYDVAHAGERSTHVVGPAEHATQGQAQALFTVLPEKKRVDVIGTPAEGDYAFYSGAGNDLTSTMTRPVTGGGTLTAQVSYDTEEGYDYWYVEASSDGTTFTPVATNLSEEGGTGITGTSEGTVALTTQLPAGTTAVRFRYSTDTSVAGTGVLVDDIQLDGVSLGTAETEDEGWTFDGWRRTTGTEESYHFNAYVAEKRGYRGYDKSLRTAYNFGFLDSRPDWVETYPYQDGLLISYWDESFLDNNVGDHPGGGLILPVDAHPAFAHSYDGQLLRPRILSYDSTFGLQRTDRITLHKDSKPTTIRSKPAVPVFDDTKKYWFDADQHGATGSHPGRYQPGWNSVRVANTGTTIRVVRVDKNQAMRVVVAPK